jgi:DNA-binding GntR family transcriptional regulator
MAVTLSFPDPDPRGEIPPYLQVAAVIEAAIRDGSLRPGQVLPSWGDLSRMSGYGRTTIRKAMVVLRGKGLVYTIATRGTYASRDIPPG